MARDGRDPDRPPIGSQAEPSARGAVDAGGTHRSCCTGALTQPRSDRERARNERDRYSLRDPESEILAIVGVFRAVPEGELHRTFAGRNTDTADTRERITSALRSLSDHRLVDTRRVVINSHPERVVGLTAAGKALLEAHRGRDGSRAQEYYSGLVKPRELAHDAQLYRAFTVERERIEAQGGRVTRVVLDYELKRDYHRSVHDQRAHGTDARDARRAFADASGLPFVDGHLEFPDIRIEYQDAGGFAQHRDVELATPHYSRSQIGGKQRAGFRVYRAAGVRGGNSAAGATPIDPHHLHWLR